MCGIFGWISRNPPSGVEGWAARASGLLQHRGPDGSGVVRETMADGTELCLGHRLLAIIGIGEGGQPFWSHDRRLIVTFNGEIYNYIELREELASKGHTFRTACDTEVLLEAYRAWGEDCVKRFRGMFAFVLYDLEEQKVVFARDPFGKKPLIYALTPGGLVFCSEIAPLLDHPQVARKLDPDALGNYLVLRYQPGPATFFEGIEKLEPGSLLVWERGQLRRKQYFTPAFSRVAPEAMTQADADDAFAEGLEDAVRIRMRSDAPFGAFLSGGLDSSVIVALMQRHSPTPLETFSVGFEDEQFSELGFARRAAERSGTSHHEIVVTPETFLTGWPEAVRLRSAPVSEASDIPILMLSHLAGRSVKMVLTGEGADELLGGYPKYLAEAYVGRYHKVLPAALHGRLFDPLVQGAPLQVERIKTLSRALAEADVLRRNEVWFGSFTREQAAALIDRPVSAPVRDGVPPGLSCARTMQLADQLSWLPDNLLERGDRMMMGGSVEGRMPFMDVELSELVARMPERMYLGHKRGKAVLRRVARRWVDREIIERRKVGFKVPLADWFRSRLRPELDDLLRSKASVTRRLVSGRRIDEMLDRHRSGRFSHVKAIWALANLEIFLREHRLDA